MKTATRLDPIKMIGNANEVWRNLASKLTDLREQIRDIEAQWDGLQRAGGARADHASALLSTLRLSLCSIARYCVRVDEKISEMDTDPFGDQSHADPLEAALDAADGEIDLVG